MEWWTLCEGLSPAVASSTIMSIHSCFILVNERFAEYNLLRSCCFFCTFFLFLQFPSRSLCMTLFTVRPKKAFKKQQHKPTVSQIDFMAKHKNFGFLFWRKTTKSETMSRIEAVPLHPQIQKCWMEGRSIFSKVLFFIKIPEIQLEI